MSGPVPRTHLPHRLTDDPDLYRRLIEHSLDIVTLVDDDGVIAYQSLSVERTLGYPPQSMLGRNIAEYIHPADLAGVLVAIGRIQSGEVAVEQAEFRFLDHTGGYRYLHAVAQSWDHSGVHGIIVSSRDVTQDHKVKVEIAENNELLAEIFSVSQNLLSISLPGTGEFLAVNDAWCQTMEHRREDVIGRTAVDLGVWGHVENRNQVINDFDRAGRLRNYEARAYTSSGAERLLLVDAQILTVAEQPRILMSCLNLTDARKIEEELRQSQKMEAIGQLTGGVAHDFNNLIGITMGNAELLLDLITDRPQAAGYARQILEASKRGADLTHQLLSFSRRQTLSPDTVDLAQQLSHLEPMLQTIVSENTHIDIQADANLWPSSIDPNQLETALLNLTLNAHDAMPDGGRLYFRLANLTIDGDDPKSADSYQRADLAPGDYVVLAVQDEGVGMPAAIQQHVFEPFFTTKETGKGTGLGLSMVFGFAKQSGGAIWVDSAERVGTTMSLLLPRATQGKASAPVLEKQPHGQDGLPKGDGETVLVIEDSDALRKLVTHTLSEIGYRVFAACGEEDLAGVVKNVDNIDLVLCDVILQGRSRGPDLTRDLLRKFPAAAVLFMTGYSPSEVLDGTDHAVLSKPFSREECSHAVRQVLDARRTRV